MNARMLAVIGLLWGSSLLGVPANAALVSFVGIDDLTKGSWVGAYGREGYILNNFDGPVGSVVSPPVDRASLPSYLSGYTYTSASGYRWPSGVAVANQIQDPTDPGNDAARRTNVAFGSNWRTTLNFSEAREVELSVYFYQTDGESRVQKYTINGDAATAQTTVGAPSPKFPRWYTWRVVGTPRAPVTIDAQYLSGGGGNAVIGVIAMDPTRAPKPLLMDTFDNVTDADAAPGYGLNYEPELSNRQFGSLGTTTYVRNPVPPASLAQVNHGGAPYSAPGQLSLFVRNAPNENAAWVITNRNFPDYVTVSASLDPVANDTTSTDWMTLGVRGQDTSFDSTDITTATDAGALFRIRSNGEWTVFVNGVDVLGPGRFVPAASRYDVSLTVMGNLLSAVVNGVVLDMNGAAPGDALTLTGLAANPANNFISLSGYTAASSSYVQHLADNLRIERIPEPAGLTLLALGLVGVALLRLPTPFPRKRKRGKG